jgi:hypothetical protein
MLPLSQILNLSAQECSTIKTGEKMYLKSPMAVAIFGTIGFLSVSQLNAATSYHCRLTVINNGSESQGKVAFDGATPVRMKVAGYSFSVSLRKIDLGETIQFLVSGPTGITTTMVPLRTPWIVAAINQRAPLGTMVQAECKAQLNTTTKEN